MCLFSKKLDDPPNKTGMPIISRGCIPDMVEDVGRGVRWAGIWIEVHSSRMTCVEFPVINPCWLVVWLPFLAFSQKYWECYHPNWRTLIFFRGVAQPPTSLGLSWNLMKCHEFSTCSASDSPSCPATRQSDGKRSLPALEVFSHVGYFLVTLGNLLKIEVLGNHLQIGKWWWMGEREQTDQCIFFPGKHENWSCDSACWCLIDLLELLLDLWIHQVMSKSYIPRLWPRLLGISHIFPMNHSWP